MHALIITPHLLHASVLSTALRNFNIQSSVATPQTLSRQWTPVTDAILLPHSLSDRELPFLIDFLSNISGKTPLIFFSSSQKYLFDEGKMQPFLVQSIFLDDTLPLNQIPLLIKDILQKTVLQERELKLGNLSIDRLSRILSMGKHSVSLSKKEFFLLELLILNSGRVTTRENIIDYVWDKRDYVASNTIDVYMSRLRKKLRPGNIITFPCLGYQLNL